MGSTNELLDRPPFPPLTWNIEWWCGEVSVEFGTEVELNVYVDDPEGSRLPSTCQANAYVYQCNNGKDVVRSVLASLYERYLELRPRYLPHLKASANQLMPEIASKDKLRNLIDLRQMHVHPWHKDGIAYVGLQFGCTWDQEHGLGVMLCNDRVVEIGSADVSFAWQPQEADGDG